jgi:hypothetical protein
MKWIHAYTTTTGNRVLLIGPRDGPHLSLWCNVHPRGKVPRIPGKSVGANLSLWIHVGIELRRARNQVRSLERKRTSGQYD